MQLEREGIIMEDAARWVEENGCGGDEDNIVGCGGIIMEDATRWVGRMASAVMMTILVVLAVVIKCTGIVNMLIVLNMQLFVQLEREGIMEDTGMGIGRGSADFLWKKNVRPQK